MDFTAEERAIFEYHNGEEKVFADPLALRQRIRFTIPNSAVLIRQSIAGHRTLSSYQQELEANPAECREMTADEQNAVRMGVAADERLVMAFRDIFGLPDIDPKTGRGVSGDCVLKVWKEYQEFLEKKSGTEPTPPTSAPPSEPQNP